MIWLILNVLLNAMFACAWLQARRDLYEVERRAENLQRDMLKVYDKAETMAKILDAVASPQGPQMTKRWRDHQFTRSL